MSDLRIGHGYDAHRFVSGRPLILGGVTVPHTEGLLGHSDADVLLHTITDALLGAAGEGDIGHHFPPSDPGTSMIVSPISLSLPITIISLMFPPLSFAQCDPMLLPASGRRWPGCSRMPLAS